MTDAKTYLIKALPAGTAPADIDWETIPAAAVDTFRWLPGGYEPATCAKLVFIREFGFVLKMVCRESAPKAVYTAYNEPVYTDSCMEFFAAWNAGDPRYMNMEMNANGTLLSCLGPDRNARTPVRDVTGGDLPVVTGEVTDGAWSVTAVIPAALLARIYGMDAAVFAPGYKFTGNFYKCGDDTEIPHYGMWNPVELPKADFHRPEFFGNLVIGE